MPLTRGNSDENAKRVSGQNEIIALLQKAAATPGIGEGVWWRLFDSGGCAATAWATAHRNQALGHVRFGGRRCPAEQVPHQVHDRSPHGAIIRRVAVESGSEKNAVDYGTHTQSPAAAPTPALPRN